MNNLKVNIINIPGAPEIIQIDLNVFPCVKEIENICVECDKILMQSEKTNVNLLYSWN